ncbi:MAG: hypothetical protein SVS85_02880 [Candidatus Nanohaloarchaea archaeon]|nr:hypothetical protein [Candidatus Nanohaloarchaea archaeon]
MKSRGQAAIEYMTVFGIALVLSTPFILRAQSSMMELRIGTQVVSLQNSLDRVESSVETVSAAGEPAQRTFFFEVPQITRNARVVNNSIVYTVRTSSGETQLIRTFETNVVGTVPETPGRHRMTVYARNGKTHIEVLE